MAENSKSRRPSKKNADVESSSSSSKKVGFEKKPTTLKAGATKVQIQNVLSRSPMPSPRMVIGEKTENDSMVKSRGTMALQGGPRYDWLTLLVFNGCTREFILNLHKNARSETLKPGQVVLEEGEATTDLIVVEKGSLLHTQHGTEVRTITCGQCPTSLAVLGLYQHSVGRISCTSEGATVRILSQEALWDKAKTYIEDCKIVRRYSAVLQGCHTLLQKVRVFEPFNEMEDKDAFFWLLSEWSIYKRLQHDDCIVRQGEKGEAMYIIESGSVAVELDVSQAFTIKPKIGIDQVVKLKGLYKKLKKERESVAATTEGHYSQVEKVSMEQLGPGSVFGELAMLGISSTRSATLKVTSSNATALEIHHDVLLRLLQLFPKEKQMFEEMVQALAVAHLDGMSKEVKISEAPPFRKCDPEFCQVLQESCDHRAFLPDQLLVQEGQLGGDVLYVVHQGKLDVEILGKVVGELKDGDCFGEATMLGMSSKATATIRTKTLVSLLMLHREAFNQALELFPDQRKHFEDMMKGRMMDQRVGPESHAFFKDCHPDFIAEIRDKLQLEVFMPDQVLVREGDIGTSMFIISAGKAVASVKGNQVAELNTGAIFGELTLLGVASRRTATITASTFCLVDKLHQHAFELALEKYPDYRRRFEELASSHLGHGSEFTIYSWPFFKKSPSRFLYLLDIHLDRVVYFSGQTIVEIKSEDLFDNGSFAFSMFVILRGCAAVFESGEKSHELKDFDFFGEMAVLGHLNDINTAVIAQTMCDVHILSKSVLDEAFQQFPEERGSFENSLAKLIAEREAAQFGEGAVSLRQTTLFKETTVEFLEQIWDSLEPVLYMPGSNIVQEGDTSDPSMYILRRGTAVVLMHGTEVHSYGPGTYFGEIGILGISSMRTATIRAKTPVVVHILHRSDFQDALREFPENKPLFSSLLSVAEGRLDSYLRRSIGNLELFAESDSSFLDAICEGVKERRYKAGEVVVDEGDPRTHQVMILVSGMLSLSMRGIPTGEVEPGELAMFGELSALGVKDRRWKAATVTAAGDGPSVVVIFNQVVLDKALRDFPSELEKFRSIDQHRNKRDSLMLQGHNEWMDATTQQLRHKVTFFRSCSYTFIRELVNHVEEEIFDPGFLLAEDRAPCESLLILLDGKADILVEGICIGKLKAGAVFGEENVLGFPRRTSTVEAQTECRTLHLQAKGLWDVLQNDEFSAEYKFFLDLRQQRIEATRHLRHLPVFAECDNLCLQQIALYATRFLIQAGRIWAPGKDAGYQGEALAIFAYGSAALEVEGFQVFALTTGFAFSEGLVHKHGGVIAARSLSALYSFRRHALLAAVLHFPKAQAWFDGFRKEQNAVSESLQNQLISKHVRLAAMKPHPIDKDIRRWAAKNGASQRNAKLAALPAKHANRRLIAGMQVDATRPNSCPPGNRPRSSPSSPVQKPRTPQKPLSLTAL